MAADWRFDFPTLQGAIINESTAKKNDYFGNKILETEQAVTGALL